MAFKQKLASEVSPGDSVLYDGKFHVVEACFTYGTSIKIKFTDSSYKLTVSPESEILIWGGNQNE